MPRRVVIHPGFHKTGTSTVQRALRVNRAVLKPHLRSILKPPLKLACHASRGYSTWRDPISLHKFRRRFRAALDEIGGMPRRSLLISAEELSGHLPGRGELADYSAAIPLARAMYRSVQEVFPDTETVFFFSTRMPESWLRSAYWQHVRASNMTLDFDDYAARYEGSADLDAIVDAVAEAVPERVERANLDTTTTLQAGPLTPLLDLCEVPLRDRAALVMDTVNEHLGEDVLQQLLEVNRTTPDIDQRNARKQDILTRIHGGAHG
ncbi:MAG: hypothetical protein AB3N23_16095 [Paracoccaceae bacterium]